MYAKNKTQFNRTVRRLIAVGLVVTVEIGSTNLFTTAQSDLFAYFTDIDLTTTLRDRTNTATNEPTEGKDAVKHSVRCKLANSDGNFDQNETQPERRFFIQDDEAPTENEDQTNQPRTFFQVVTNFLKRAFGSCFKSIFGASKED